jgi:hypothetical protein
MGVGGQMDEDGVTMDEFVAIMQVRFLGAAKRAR